MGVMRHGRLLSVRTDRDILRIAVPSIISNVTVPLLGLVDVAIVGHLGRAAYIGAIAVGGMVFNVIYWIFGFLRMGTSGMTSQALGGGRHDETVRMLVRSTVIGMAVAAVLMLLQRPVLYVAMLFMHPGAEVTALASSYFRICIWGAPAMLGMFALNGWYIGMQNSRIPMIVAIVQNIINILASVMLVMVAGMKVEGVACGTLIAQWSGFVLALCLLAWHYGRYVRRHKSFSSLWDSRAMRRFFSVNRDIFLRTVCLVAVMLSFTAAGAWQGDIVLAVNTMLMQMYMLFSYIMDGFAYAGEALTGKAYGGGNAVSLRLTVRRLFVWGLYMTVPFTLAYAFGGDIFVSLLTDDGAVAAAAGDYLVWAVALPAAGVAAFIWDGVFIGCTFSRGMLVSCFTAAVFFFVIYHSLSPLMANHALWLAFIVFLFMRGLVQTVIYKRKIKTL